MTIDMDAGRQLRASGLSWNAISVALGATYYRTRAALDPGYGDKIRTSNRFSESRLREARRRKNDAGKIHFEPLDRTPIRTLADAERLLAEVPKDTRGLTARLMGDPIPGRRAIDLKGL